VRELPRARTRTIASRSLEVQTKLVELTPNSLPSLDEAGQVLDDFSVFWRDRSDPEVKRLRLQLVFERVWLDEDRSWPCGRTTPSSRPSSRARARRRGVNDGSDGTRTRDLGCDRPVLALSGRPRVGGNSSREQAIPILALRGFPGVSGSFRRPPPG